MITRKRVKLSTDGACLGNPGRGGWAYVLRDFNNHTEESYGCDLQTTNNQMELQAVIQGLKALRESCDVTTFTDSQYVQRGITEWLPRWKKNGWRTSEKHPVKNRDLWEQLDKLLAGHSVSGQWVKGHADDEDNLRCHELANRAARDQISSGDRGQR